MVSLSCSLPRHSIQYRKPPQRSRAWSALSTRPLLSMAILVTSRIIFCCCCSRSSMDRNCSARAAAAPDGVAKAGTATTPLLGSTTTWPIVGGGSGAEAVPEAVPEVVPEAVPEAVGGGSGGRGSGGRCPAAEDE